MNDPDGLIDWKAFGETRNLLGAGFVRILGYFLEDGTKSVAAIEEAMRLKDSAKLVMPAHTLKGEAWQFGANRLALLAEEIEDPFGVDTNDLPAEQICQTIESNCRDIFQ